MKRASLADSARAGGSVLISFCLAAGCIDSGHTLGTAHDGDGSGGSSNGGGGVMAGMGGAIGTGGTEVVPDPPWTGLQPPHRAFVL